MGDELTLARVVCPIKARRECPFGHKCNNVSVATDSECAEFIRAARLSRRFIIGTGYSVPQDFVRRFLCEPYVPHDDWRKDNPMLRQAADDAVEAEYLRQERQAIQEETLPDFVRKFTDNSYQ